MIKYAATATIDAPVDQIDLEHWIYNLSDEDYQACAKGHQGAGAFTENGVRGTINVESVGGMLMIQHYLEVSADASQVDLLSKSSRAYVFHIFPVSVGVRWTMTATPLTADTTTFTCTVETIIPAALRFTTPIVSYFLRKHVQEETQLFADDITRKLGPHSSTTH